jgi:nitrous oxidase accessory protein
MKWTILNIILCAIWYPLQAGTWKVSPGTALSSVKQAIALSGSFDTIYIGKGLYKEGNIEVDKPLYIRGEAGAILDGENKYEILSIRSDDVTIEGLRIQHAGRSSMNDLAGIKIYRSKRVSILSNDLFDTHFAIYGDYVSQCIITNNTIVATGTTETNSGNGIHCWKSDSVSVMHNTIIGHRDGIYFEFVTNSMIVGNLSKGNIRYGLHFMFSHQNNYIMNRFINNGAGVAVMYTREVGMYWNYFEENWGSAAYGILLKDISDSEISGNIFKRNTMGIYMEGSNRVNLTRNNFINNGWALRITANCENSRITSNNFLGNTFDVSTNGSRSLNVFEGNYWDKYEGYDLDRDGTGDVPFRPVSLYSMIVEVSPVSTILMRSFIVSIMDKAEKIFPGITPAELKDDLPLMKSLCV